jgi:hypothetical protein
MLNSDFSRKRAAAFAHRLDREAGSDLDKRIKWAFRLAMAECLNQGESDSTKRFLTAQQQVYSKEKDGDKRAWVDFCQMLLASNSFMYVE